MTDCPSKFWLHSHGWASRLGSVLGGRCAALEDQAEIGMHASGIDLDVVRRGLSNAWTNADKELRQA
jgi:hypothetical protein